MGSTTELTYESTSRTLTGEYELHYHQAGPSAGAAASGAPGDDAPVLVLLHGSGPGVSGWSNFAGNLPVFAAHFRTYVLDMPAFGRSPQPSAWTDLYPRVAADALRFFLDELGIVQAHLLGNSMGGNAAAEFALAHPERAGRLVLMGPGGLAVNTFGPQVSEGTRRLFAFLAEPSRDAMRAWVETMVADPALITDALLDARTEAATAPGACERAASVFATFSDPRFADEAPLWARADRLTHRTLLTWGREDRMLPYEGALFPFSRLPDAELHVFARCGHWAQVERKEEFERVVLEFLRRP
ncbi:alpha/beta fold hydrolase [Streptomyces iconiensis]|uniref:Alpha/beta fold hydrolase n=1 Tax=Streptomyces iconiensis TaxID=1384038 RepID=A0ABT7A2G8_9ACTN|nr:alpha/beta fold hydrolase [Streptomyces iconiensis]MDJ1135517.1 alpha/beta fold hydrolase [Streptomyces iconiensis]